MVSLLSSPSPLYEALSYVWGDLFDPQSITLNGHPFYVTSALNTALLHLRSRTEERRFWVDALCINQADVEERNEQVRMMGRIYAGARRVLVWLGAPEEDGRDEEAFEALRGVVQWKGLGVEARKMEELFGWFFGVMERPWFRRMWIMQELALASQEVRVGCGRWWVDWETFVGAWKVLARTEFEMGFKEQVVRRHGGEGLDGGEEVEVLMKVKLDLLDDLRRVVVEHGGQSLRQLLLISRSSQATEPRDRVYALRGMMREEDRDAIVVDYRKSIPVVFAEAVAHVFDKSQGPYFLSGLLLPGPDSESGFPSWVPDFTAQVAYEAGRPGPLALHPRQGTSASGGGFDCVNGEVLEDMKTLKIEGLFLDIVEDVLVFDRTFEGCLQQLPQVEALADQARRRTPVDTTLRPYFQSFKQEEPLWRTLVCNKDKGGTNPAPIFYEDTYEVLRGRRDASPEYAERGQEGMDQFIQDYSWRLRNILPSRAFFTTESGFVGIGMPETRKGDLVTIWFGAPVPFVVRPREEIYSLVGVAYVAGIMDGGMVDELYCEDLVDSKSFLVQ